MFLCASLRCEVHEFGWVGLSGIRFPLEPCPDCPYDRSISLRTPPSMELFDTLTCSCWLPSMARRFHSQTVFATR